MVEKDKGEGGESSSTVAGTKNVQKYDNKIHTKAFVLNCLRRAPMFVIGLVSAPVLISLANEAGGCKEGTTASGSTCGIDQGRGGRNGSAVNSSSEEGTLRKRQARILLFFRLL